ADCALPSGYPGGRRYRRLRGRRRAQAGAAFEGGQGGEDPHPRPLSRARDRGESEDNRGMNLASRGARVPLVLLALGAIWGASFLFIKVIVDETGPVEVAFGRLFIGAVAILAFVRVRRLSVPWTPSLLAKVGVLALVANIAPFALIAWGEEHIESGMASVLNSTMPIFTAVFAAAVLPEERFSAAAGGRTDAWVRVRG